MRQVDGRNPSRVTGALELDKIAEERARDGDMAYDEHHDHDDYTAHEGGLYASAAATGPDPSVRHRRRLVASTTVAAVALVAAGFLTVQLMNEQQPSLPEPEALAPQTAPATASSTPEETAPVSRTPKITRHAAPVELSPVPSVEASRPASPDSAEARASAAIDELRERLRVSERTKIVEHPYADGEMQVVSFWRDATGEPLLRLARDQGTPAGNGVRCTTRIRNDPARDPGPPATLLCWRTSASRSVVVVSTATPAGAEAVGVAATLLETEWPKPN
ncbi:hypothetical protein Q0Z83_105250 [Actinoplanes sichuanensis]|uniref:Uncharacterized protein n=1 Tax=Actinoplanes sichuanensis TaxID=512349 RepID=A0ABW4AHQ5_9ACTN|nr:hypothetical protein [Actinoplanes sichuanensis]BEL12334.1 hypothetical protein Q0Z83_105250 [Actinoplanes sichuanensis]